MPVARTQDSKYENCKVRVKYANYARLQNVFFVAHLHALWSRISNLNQIGRLVMHVARTQDNKHENCKVCVKFAKYARLKSFVFVAYQQAIRRLHIKLEINRPIGYACSADTRF